MMLLENPIQTERLILKNLSAQDADGPYVDWLNDSEINRFLEVRHNVPDVSDIRRFIETMNQSQNNLLLGMFNSKREHIGNIKLGPISKVYSRGMMGLLIGDKSQWGKGLATEVIVALTDYAFSELALSSIWAGCYSSNLGSYKAFLKAGYEESGRQRRYWKDGSDFVDNVMLVKYNSTKAKG